MSGLFGARGLTCRSRVALERVQDLTLDVVDGINEVTLDDVHASLLLAELAARKDAEGVRRAIETGNPAPGGQTDGGPHA